MLHCTCEYLDIELRGIQTLLSGCRWALRSNDCLYDLTNGVAGALHCNAMPCRRPWTPPYLVLYHEPPYPYSTMQKDCIKGQENARLDPPVSPWAGLGNASAESSCGSSAA